MNDVPEQFKELTPESLELVKEAIDAKVKAKVELHVEQALAQQDELYSSKLEALLEALDKDHSKKLERIVEAIEIDKAKKLKLVIERYEKAMNRDAKKFKALVVERLSLYLDTYLKEVIPVADIKQAVKNKKAIAVLESLRKTLAIDSVIQKEAIREAVLDGQSQLNSALERISELESAKKTLQESVQKTKTELLIESKTSTLSDTDKTYIKKVMNGKSLEFIKENFDYAVKLLDKRSADRIDILKEEALNEREDVDHVILEDTETSTPSTISPYLQELGKY